MKKSRGSTHGLIQNREDTKKKNTEAMWNVINHLRKSKENEIWTYREVWTGAGLKSNVALKSAWNQHIKAVIDEHNQQIRENIDLGTIGRSQRKTLRITNKELRSEISQLTNDKNLSLSQIAIWEAEASYYKKENDDLRRIIDRLKGKLDSITNDIQHNHHRKVNSALSTDNISVIDISQRKSSESDDSLV